MHELNFDERARRAIVLAREQSVALGHEYVGTEHILLGLLQQPHGPAAAVLHALDADPGGIRRLVLEVVKTGRATAGRAADLPFTSRAKKSLELAILEAHGLGHPDVGSEHLLLGLRHEAKGIAGQVLHEFGVTLDGARAAVQRVREHRDRGMAEGAMPPRAGDLIDALGLQPHPEGGYYREIFRSADSVQPADGRGARAALTTIYFLLPAGSVSRWHRVASDEAWHLYEGGPLELLQLDPSGGNLERHLLAPLGDGAGAPAHVVPAGCWQAARPLGDYALAGCTVGPGFDFADFRLLAEDAAAAAAMRKDWPTLAALI